MANIQKPRIIKDYEKLDKDMKKKVNEAYPNGFTENLINYTDPKTGLERFALPFETEDRYYMIRVDEFIESQIDSPSSSDEDDDIIPDEIPMDVLKKSNEDIPLEGEDEEDEEDEEDDEEDEDTDDAREGDDDEDEDDDYSDEGDLDDEDEDEEPQPKKKGKRK